MIDLIRFNSFSHSLRNAIRKKELLDFDSVSSYETEAASLINSLINLRERKCEDYLEIGVEFGRTLAAVKAEKIWGVDPAPLFSAKSSSGRLCLMKTTSDSFFEKLEPGQRFDFIFLDGLHQALQTYRDLVNSMSHIKADGIIVIDDVLPVDDLSADPNMWRSIRKRRMLGKTDMAWHGDVYRVVLEVVKKHPNLNIFVVNDEKYRNGRAVIWNFSETPLEKNTDLSSASLPQSDYVSTLKRHDLLGNWEKLAGKFVDSRI